jgi:hypothetical protein
VFIAGRLVRRRLAGLEPPPQALSPRFQDWAEVHYRERSQHMTRSDMLEHHLRVVLRFWGARPDTGEVPSEPYHDLRLNDVVRDPAWIEQFEVWMRARETPRWSAP